MSLTNSRPGPNPFLDEEVDDFTFLNHPQHGKSGYMLETSPQEDKVKNEWEVKRMQLLEERRRIEERTLQSTNTSLGLLYESEQVGVATAEELVNQREQLENVEQNIDKINSTMRISQKHINSIKSMFGGIKNYFSRNNSPDPSLRVASDSTPAKQKPSATNLQDTVIKYKEETSVASSANHPALRIRGIDASGFDDLDVHKDATDLPDSLHRTPRDLGGKPLSPQQAYSSHSQDIDERLDKNLEELGLGLGRLKNLAISLNVEIDEHNEMIDRIDRKVERADESLEHQNRQIKRILKK